MAYTRKRMCSKAGCHEYALDGCYYCAAHKPKSAVKSEFAYMYNNAWWKRSRAWLRQPEHSWCEICGKPADTVHHKIEHKGDWGLFWDENNWQAICKSCHSQHHATETNRRRGKEDK